MADDELLAEIRRLAQALEGLDAQYREALRVTTEQDARHRREISELRIDIAAAIAEIRETVERQLSGAGPTPPG